MVESIEANALAHLARSLEKVGVEVQTIDLDSNSLTAHMDTGDDVHVCGMAENVAGRWGLALHTNAAQAGEGQIELKVTLSRKSQQP